MYVLRSFCVVTLAAVLVVPAIQAVQDSDRTESLTRRVQLLDTMLASLQKRVEVLERTAAAPALAPPPEPAAVTTGQAPALPERPVPTGRGWRALRKGMSMSDVRVVLGEPTRVNASFFTTWYYPGSRGRQATVAFDNDNLVSGWSEP